MAKHIDADRLRAEINSFMNPDEEWKHLTQEELSFMGRCKSYVFSVIDSLQQAEEEMLGKSLDEAAEESAISQYSMSETDEELDVVHSRILHEVGFKAGAKWMAGQGVTCEGKVFTSAFTSYVKTPGIEELLKDVFPEDTEVIVQIRKKEGKR